jgi:hypothetical protein
MLRRGMISINITFSILESKNFDQKILGLWEGAELEMRELEGLNSYGVFPLFNNW